MEAEQRPEFAKLIADALAFWRQEVTDFTLTVWWNACQPYDLEQVRHALGVHATDPSRGQFPPMPADITKALKGTGNDRATIAWGKVMEAMPRVGAYRSIVFDDPAIHRAIHDMGGWPAMCKGQVDELPFTERRFMTIYGTYARHGMSLNAWPTKLVGISEHENIMKGADRAIGEPVYFGERAVCLAVERGPQAAIGERAMTQNEALPHADRMEQRTPPAKLWDPAK